MVKYGWMVMILNCDLEVMHDLLNRRENSRTKAFYLKKYINKSYCTLFILFDMFLLK